MSRQAKTQLVWAVASVVVLAGVVVLAFVKNQAAQPQSAAGATLEDIAKSAESWETGWAGRYPTFLCRTSPEEGMR
ncbi:MAG: hypothetical protein ACYS74_12865 [Planctomycetota bacterium]|jgi:hypothetical protein